MNYSMKKIVASGESNPAALKRAATALAILHGVSRRMQETLLSIINEVSIYEKGRAACRTKRTPICKTINKE